MSLWILDTDCVSLFQKGHPLVSRRVNAVGLEEVAVTIVTVEEQLRGRLDVIRRNLSSDEIVSAYARLGATLNYFRTINLVDFDRNAYTCYRELIHQRIRIGTRDLLIAAITISRNGILVTRNRRDFERVPGLVFEDWSIG